MKKVNQKIFEKNKGDCFRACVASIFEFDIDFMPNFWEQTQDAAIFWRLVNKFTSEKLGYKCIVINVEEENAFFIDNLLCIAIDFIKDSKTQHALVWKNGLIHDPNKFTREKRINWNPNQFVIFSKEQI